MAITRYSREPTPTCDVRSSRCGTTRTVAVVGELDLAGVRALDRAVNDALDERPETVVIDLSATAFIDSAGMGSLVRGHRRAVARDVRLVIIPAPARVHRIFELCGLDDVLPFVSAR